MRMKNASPPCPLHKRKIFHAAFNLSSSRQSKLYVGFKYNLDNAGAKPCKRVTREDRSRQNIESDSTRAEARTIGRCTAVSVYIFQNIMPDPFVFAFCSLLLALCWLGGSLPMDPLWQSPRRGTEAFSPFSRCLPDGHHVGCRLRSGNCASGS